MTMDDAGRDGAPNAERAWPLARLVLLAVLLLAGGVVVLTGHLPAAATVRAWVSRGGGWVPVAFVLAYAAATLLPAPKWALSTAAGLVFGLGTGWVLVWAGAMLGAAAGFWLGRALGRDGVHRIAARHLGRLDALVERHGVLAILAARLVPFIPFTAVNYASGVTTIRCTTYLLATGAGILPGTFAYVAVGAYGGDPGRWPFLLGVAVLVGLSVAGLVGARRARTGATGSTDDQDA